MSQVKTLHIWGRAKRLNKGRLEIIGEGWRRRLGQHLELCCVSLSEKLPV